MDDVRQPLSDGDHDDIRVVRTDGREFIIVGTAHVSQESADLVRELISRERPDRVCVELDEQRAKALTQEDRWENLDLKQVIRRKQLPTLIVNLLLVSYQRKIGSKLGVTPGTELLEAVQAARDLEIPVSLCDRNIRTTMLRAWRSMSFWQRSKLVSGLVASVFEDTELTEEDLRELRKHDVLSELLNELAVFMPTLKSVLIDERDAYLAQRIRESEGTRVVAVVGAGHVDGICKLLQTAEPVDTAALEVIPSALPVGKMLAWGIPIAIIASLGLLAWTRGPEVAGENAVFWVLANGIPSAIGAGMAFAHPLTVVTAFFAAPITTLSPLIGAGYVTAMVQVWLQPPLVRDFNHLTEEVGHLRMWWRNRLLRVVLAFVLPQLGSLIGTWLGVGKIISSLAG